MSTEEEDRAAIEAYRRKHGEGPFLAADALVTSADGAVLLVRRSSAPQKGRFAFPGGFLQPDETLLQCALRELEEETRLTLSGSAARPIAGPLLRDAPDRDPRARIVSAVFRFSIAKNAADAVVAGGDDAADAVWAFPDGGLKQHDLYADHYQVLVQIGLISG